MSRGQFFVISVIVIVITITLLLAYLVSPFSLSITELDRLNTELLNVNNFFDSLQESSLILQTWENPILNNKIKLSIINNDSVDHKDIYYYSLNAGNSFKHNALSVYNDNALVNADYHLVNESSGLIDVFIPIDINSEKTAAFRVFWNNESTYNFRKDTNINGVYFDALTSKVITNYYIAYIDKTKGALVDNITDRRTGAQYIGDCANCGLFNLYCDSTQQASLTVIDEKFTNNSLNFEAYYELSDLFNIRLKVWYLFFVDRISAYYELDKISGNFSSCKIITRQDCAMNWTAIDSADNIISNFCNNPASTISTLTPYVSLLSNANTSASLFLKYLSIDDANKTTSILSEDDGVEFNISLEDNASSILISTLFVLDFYNSNSSFTKSLSALVNNGLTITSEYELISDRINSFINSNRLQYLERGVSTLVDIETSKGAVKNNIGQLNWFKGFFNALTVRVYNSNNYPISDIVSLKVDEPVSELVVTDELGNIVDSGFAKNTIYFKTSISADDFKEFNVKFLSDNITFLEDGNGILTEADDFLLFNNSFLAVNIHLNDGSVNYLVFNNTTFSGAFNDFKIMVNGEYKSLSSDFTLSYYELFQNPLLTHINLAFNLSTDNNISVTDSYNFFNDTFTLERNFFDNSSTSYLGTNGLWWGGNTPSPTVNGVNMSDVYYGTSGWDGCLQDSNPSRAGMEGNFTLMWWDDKSYLASVIRINDSSDLKYLSFGLLDGCSTQSQRPYWTQRGTFNNVSFSLLFKGGKCVSRESCVLETEDLSNRFLNPPLVSIRGQSLTKENLFDYSQSFFIKPSTNHTLNNIPFTSHFYANSSTISSLAFTEDNALMKTQALSNKLTPYQFNGNIKNVNDTSPVNFLLFNPVEQQFNITIPYTGISVNTSYKLFNPRGTLINSGSSNSDVTFSVNGSYPGFYRLELLSGGTFDVSSAFNINSSLSSICLKDNPFGFTGDRTFYFYVKENISSVSFRVSSPLGNNSYKYTFKDENNNTLISGSFSQGETTDISATFTKFFDGQVLSLTLEDPSIKQISFMTVTPLTEISCISAVEDYINDDNPLLTLLTYVTFRAGEERNMDLLGGNKVLSTNYDSSLSWSQPVLNNSLISFNFSDSNLSLKNVGNWIKEWTIENEGYTATGFSGYYLFEDGPLRKVVNAISNTSINILNSFIFYESQSFFKVSLSNFTISENPLILRINFSAGGDADYWYKISGYAEEDIFDGKSFDFEELSCEDNMFYVGKKDSNNLLSLIIPCEHILSSSDTVQIYPDYITIKLSKSTPAINLFVYVSDDYRWSEVEKLVSMINGFKIRKGNLNFDWHYSSGDLIVS